MAHDYFLIKTNNGNHYLYSYYKKQVLLIHPLVYFFSEMKKKKQNIKHWTENFEEGNIVEIGNYHKNEIGYYYQKYLFLKKNKYFEKKVTKWSKYTSEDISFHLANTAQLSFEITESCNLKCEYCINGKFYVNREHHDNRNLSIDTAKSVLNDVEKLLNSSKNSSHSRNLSIGFFGGEPLLNFKFIYEIVEYAKKLKLKHNSITFSITTNGVLLNKHMKFLADNNFDLDISLDGGTKEGNYYRKLSNNQNSFDIVYGNIKTLQKEFPSYFEKSVNFNAVLHSRNSYQEINDFFKSEFNKVPMITELVANSVNMNNELQKEFKSIFQSEEKSIRKIENYTEFEKKYNVGNMRRCINFINNYSGYVKNSYLELFEPPPNNESRLPTGTCEPFTRKIYVTAKGNILPCEKIGHQFTFGSADTDGIHLDYESIAIKYNEYFKNILSNCEKCFEKFNCNRCMFFENIESKNSSCEGFSDYSNMLNFLTDNISYIEQNPEVYKTIMTKLYLI